MSRQKQLQQSALCMAIGGSDDIECPGISVVEDYFLREREENNRESGLPNVFKIEVPVDEQHPLGFVLFDHNPDVGRNRKEIEAWLHEKNLAELEQARTNRPDMEYPRDWENDFGAFYPKPRVTETV